MKDEIPGEETKAVSHFVVVFFGKNRPNCKTNEPNAKFKKTARAAWKTLAPKQAAS